jgi:hypothetical protein
MGQAKATVMIVSLSAGSVPWCFSYAQLAWPGRGRPTVFDRISFLVDESWRFR